MREEGREGGRGKEEVEARHPSSLHIVQSTSTQRIIMHVCEASEQGSC